MAIRVSPTALRVFEAVARHLSFTRAADELFVTQSAVSQQVAQLEARLGKKLLERRGRSLRLTADGEVLSDACRRGFALLDAAVERVAAGDDAHRLRFKVPPTFAMKWLMPRLPRFQVLHPQVEINLSTSIQPADFDTENVDISVLRAAEPDPRFHYVAVLEERMMLVCAPKLWGRRRRSLQALEGMTVLHTANRRDDWENWLRQAGATGIQPGNQLEFEFSLLVYQAAVEGLGVAVAQPELVTDEIAAGRLIAPFAHVFPTGRRYFLISPDSRRHAPATAQFLRWVANEASAGAPS
jgi:LysR family glycine cleavage system transcriptional activator